MLYTIMPIGSVMNHEELDTQYEYQEVSLENNILQLYKTGNEYTIKRIVSTNPSDYLDDRLSPGNILNEMQLNEMINK